MSSLLLYSLLLVGPGLIRASTTLNISNPKCQDVIEDWLWNIQPSAEPSTASLNVNWEELDRSLKKQGCVYENLWLQLWITKDPNVKWKREEVHDYGYCDNLNVNHFRRHSVQSHRPNESHSQFHHVVESQYLFRICPCGKRPVARRCDCEYKESRPICSDIYTVPEEQRLPENQVFDWCRNSSTVPQESSVVQLLAPVAKCDEATIAGTIASCTNIQPGYDRVKVTLHKAEGDIKKCDIHDHTVATATQLNSSLDRVNATHGQFRVNVSELEHGTTYCVTLQLLDHPYCQRDIVYNSLSAPLPVVCTVHVIGHPFQTSSDCGIGPITIKALTSPVTLVILCLSLLMLLVCVCFTCWYFFMRPGKHTESRDPMVNHDALKTNGFHQKVVMTPDPDILLLHFADRQDFVEVNIKLREWLSTLGVNVKDPADEANHEAIAADQESWAQNILSKPDSKVVVVNSPLAVQAASAVSAETDPMMGREESDALHDIKVNALRLVQSQYISDYKRLCIVTHSALRPGKNDLKDLTSLREICLPEHLDELAEWTQFRAGSKRKDLNPQAEKRLIEAMEAFTRQLSEEAQTVSA